MNENRYTILVVDDHPLFRKGVIQLLALEPKFEVVGEAGDFARILLAHGHLPLVVRAVAIPLLREPRHLRPQRGLDVGDAAGG